MTSIRMYSSNVEAVHSELGDEVHCRLGDFSCSFGDHRCSQAEDLDVEASRFELFFFFLFRWRREIGWLRRSSPWDQGIPFFLPPLLLLPHLLQPKLPLDLLHLSPHLPPPPDLLSQYLHRFLLHLQGIPQSEAHFSFCFRNFRIFHLF